MVRFLSAEWFARLGELTEPANPTAEPFVVEQIVVHAPEGEVRYHIVIGESEARVVEGPAAQAHVVLTSDYKTASAIARGELSAETALLEGRIRVRGEMDRLGQQAPALVGIDPVPPRMRDETSYEGG